jgi:hypothetical protein
VRGNLNCCGGTHSAYGVAQFAAVASYESVWSTGCEESAGEASVLNQISGTTDQRHHSARVFTNGSFGIHDGRDRFALGVGPIPGSTVRAQNFRHPGQSSRV